MREILFALALLVSALLVCSGLALIDPAAALIIGGLLFAGWSWLVLGDPDPAPEPELDDAGLGLAE